MKAANSRGMTAVTTSLVVLWLRVGAHWRLLLVLLAGVLTATMLLAGTPMFLGASKELGLRHALLTERTGVLDTAIQVPYRPLDPATIADLDRRVHAQTQRALRGLVNLEVFHIRTPGMDLTASGVPKSFKANLVSFSGYEAHTLVVDGRLPQPSAPDTQYVEGAVGQGSARSLRLETGDEIILSPYSPDASRNVVVRITGILAEKEPEEPYWAFSISPFDLQGDISTGDEIPMLPVIIGQNALTTDVAPRLRGTIVDYWWFLYVDPTRIHGNDTDALRKNLADMELALHLDLPGSNTFTGLTGTLDAFDEKLFFSRIPIMVLLLLIVLLVVCYIGLIANTVVDHHLEETALLRSRGANTFQVLFVYVWEALFICLLCALVAPLIAFALMPLLGLGPGFSAATKGALLPVSLTRQVWLFAGGAAILSFLAMLFPALKGARFSMLTARAGSARPLTVAGFHRYHLDLFLLALTALLYWELTQRGSLVTKHLFGISSVDYLLLAMPAMLMLGASLLVLRFAPVVLRGLSRVAAYFGRAWLVLAIWSIARNPVHYLRPAVLLTLVAGLATFASSFNTTINQSYQDRGRYIAGGDVLLAGIPPVLSGESSRLAGDFEEFPGVAHAAAAYRFPSSGSQSSYRVLAVNTLDFQAVSWYRDDFLSKEELFGMMRRLDRGRQILQGMDLPVGTQELGLWVKPAKAYANISLWFLLKDARGASWRIKAGYMDSDQWRFMAASTRTDQGDSLPQPLVLQAILLRELDPPNTEASPDRLALGFISSAHLNFSDLTAFTDAGPAGVVIDTFRTPTKWQVISTSRLLPERLIPSSDVPREEEGSTEFSWQGAHGVGTRGIFRSDFGEPLPIIAGDAFLSATGARVGSIVEINVGGVTLPVKVADSVSFFPTMNPRDPFIIGNIDTLLYEANLFRTHPQILPNEVWISLKENQKGQEDFETWLRASPYRPYIQQDVHVALATLRSDPLVGASSRGVVFAAFGVLLFVAVGGYIGYVAMASFRSTLELAIFRALGMSTRHVLAMQGLVHGIVLLGSAALGGWVGMRAHVAMIDFLKHTERGVGVLPPLTSHTDWSGLLLVLAAFAGILSVILIRTFWTYRKIPVWAVLRKGGE